MGIAGVCLALALLVGSALIEFNLMPSAWRPNGPLARAGLASADTGAIVFTPPDGNDCRRIVFSNRTGWFGPDQAFHCNSDGTPDLSATREIAALPRVGPAERMDSIRKAFESRAAR
jgi:hypothetical protein